MVKKELSIYDELGEERKRLQTEGKLPEWVTTPAWQILKENYLTEKHPDLLSVYTRISTHAASYTPNPDHWREKFFNLLWNGWLAASSPVLSNMGTGIGCAVSCSGGYINDSVYDFYDAQKEAAVLSKNGFGTSGYLGAIRTRGSKIAGMKGAASGVLPVFKDFVQLSRDISQGSQRRGAWAGYIEIDHGDFHELVNYIAKNPDDANIGWNVSDEFIARLDSGDPDAIERYQKALKLKMITGKGYFFFVDKVNRQAPQMYKDHGLEIKASNLCLTGDTLIKIKISDVVNSIKLEDFVQYFTPNSSVQVQTYLDGSVHWSTVSAAAQTAVVTELYEIVAGDKSIKCTGNHKIFTVNRGYVEAKDLTDTDYLLDVNGESVSFSITVIEVEETPVYDITVPETECFFANDLLVHNCAEIALFSDKDHTFSCVLSSMNLSKYDEWKDTTAVFDSTVFLDCVNQDLVEIGKRTRGMEKITRFAEKSRALGLGVLGFHTYLQDHMIPFASMDAYFKNIEIFQHLDSESKRASEWMATEFGEPEWCKGYGVRNTHRLTCPPTLTNSLVVGSVSQGIEPIYKNVYIQNTAAGKMNRVNPTLLRLMKEKGVYSDETLKDIIDHNGSVQHVDWLKDDEKEVFLTAFEIPQTQIIRLASARQKYIDQAQSINLFFSADEDEEYISEVHKMAFKDPYVKSLYYIRSENGVNVNKSECTTCQG